MQDYADSWFNNKDSNTTKTSDKKKQVQKEEIHEKKKDHLTLTKEESKDTNETQYFSLQHYVNKLERYLDTKDINSTKPSHYEKMKRMPVIGE